ncbi:hypothetical protein IWX91DRAFT_171392 [Phyllosticta citricarpa]
MSHLAQGRAVEWSWLRVSIHIFMSLLAAPRLPLSYLVLDQVSLLIDWLIALQAPWLSANYLLTVQSIHSLVNSCTFALMYCCCPYFLGRILAALAYDRLLTTSSPSQRRRLACER